MTKQEITQYVNEKAIVLRSPFHHEPNPIYCAAVPIDIAPSWDKVATYPKEYGGNEPEAVAEMIKRIERSPYLQDRIRKEARV